MSSRKLGEIIFIGKPSEFASLLKYLIWEIDRETGVFYFPKQRIEGRYVETPIDPESTGFAVGFDRLVSDKEPPFWVKGGRIIVHTLPNGKTKLTANARRVKPKDHESELLITWEWLCEYLREHGWAETVSGLPKKQSEKCESILPKGIETRERWAEAWQWMRDMDDEYSQSYSDFDGPFRPLNEDYRDRVISKMGWNVGIRTITSVKRAGKGKCLDDYMK